MSTTLISKTPSDAMDAELRRCAAMLGMEFPRFLYEMSKRYFATMEDEGRMGRQAIVLDMSTFGTEADARSAAECFNGYAEKARVESETADVFRTKPVGAG